MKHDHLCIITGDAEKLISWYKEKLSFEFIQKWTVEVMPGLELCYIGRDEFKIEIVGNIPDTRERGTTLENIAGGYNHFAIAVDDIDQAIQELTEKEVTIVAPVMDVPQAGIRAAMIADVDGNTIELIEKIA